MNGYLSLLAAFTFVVLVAAASCGSAGSGAETAVPEPCPAGPTDCTLRSAARAVDLDVGAAVTADQLADGSTTAALVAEQFGSVTPEYEGTWPAIEEQRGHEDFDAFDRIVDFATAHHIAVRGHVLVWDRRDELPGWVRHVDDRDQLRAIVDRHVRSVVGRYAGRVARWDVVNEPLQTSGDELHGDHLLPILGKRYIADAFRSAHAADPTASLWLNESNVERDAGKADALVRLVGGLVDDGVPIDGVGIQAHLLSGRPTQPGVLAHLVGRLRDLGVEVAVTELDVPRATSGSTTRQTIAYRRVASECRRAGCSEITVWGVDNSHTWLDDELGRPDTDPLLFDARGRPTPAFRAFRRGLSD